MSRFVQIVLWLNMAVLTVLAFVYASLMISPGHLIEGHKDIEGDCFACHTLFIGASDDKCIACHKVKDIGLRTTTGFPVQPKDKDKTPVAFHQKLTAQECVACHSDHVGIAMYRAQFKFSHNLLDVATQKDCVACHAKPKDNIHKSASTVCSQCHTSDKWKPATFKHELLPKAELEQCVSCHKAATPKDKLHDTSSEKCGLCHVTDKWKPLEFKHANLAKADLENCATCHTAHTPKDKTHDSLTPGMLAKCGACHTTEKWKPATFKHNLLPKAELEQCVSCHKAVTPKDKLHKNVSDKCGLCHVTDKWKPATFKHNMLPKAELEQCASCHKAATPKDKTHDRLTAEMRVKCGICHVTDKWKPASFKHSLLAKAELEQCASCHKAATPKDKTHDRLTAEMRIKCGICHKTEKWKPAGFKHDLLPRAELRQCVTCHAAKAPNDQRHRDASKRCGNCHYTDRWEPAKKRNVTPSGSPSNTGSPLGGDWWLGGGGDDD